MAIGYHREHNSNYINNLNIISLLSNRLLRGEQMKIITLILSLTFLVPAFACQNATKVKTGTPAPCEGWHVSEPTMQNIMKNEEQLELQKKLQSQLEHLRKLDAQEIEFYRTQSKNNQKALDKSEQQKFWVGAGAFALGVILTGIAAKAAIESTR
jgi:hypothetical protein